MTREDMWKEITEQYLADKKKRSSWPDHICGQASMVTAAAGKLSASAIEKKYHPKEELGYRRIMEDQAVKTIVAAMRFLENLK